MLEYNHPLYSVYKLLYWSLVSYFLLNFKSTNYVCSKRKTRPNLGAVMGCIRNCLQFFAWRLLYSWNFQNAVVYWGSWADFGII